MTREGFTILLDAIFNGKTGLSGFCCASDMMSDKMSSSLNLTPLNDNEKNYVKRKVDLRNIKVENQINTSFFLLGMFEIKLRIFPLLLFDEIGSLNAATRAFLFLACN